MTPSRSSVPTKGAPATADRPITWGDVRDIPYTDLAIGDRYIVPVLGTASVSSPDGRVRGLMWTPLEGVIWRVLGHDGDAWTVCRDDGSDVKTARPRSYTTALRITARESR